MGGTSWLVACRGRYPTSGLHSVMRTPDGWTDTQITQVDDLSSLAWHPDAHVLFGTSGTQGEGELHVWLWDAGGEARHQRVPSGGEEPCHVAVSPDGAHVVVVNYTSGNVALWALNSDGTPSNTKLVTQLTGGGSGADISRQDANHPHQAVFLDAEHFVVSDLGADQIIGFRIDGSLAREIWRGQLPAGTGPRHLAILPDGRIAIDGELSEHVLIGPIGASSATEWLGCASSSAPHPSRTRHHRNHLGDLQASSDGRLVYVANRGYDTISTIDVSGARPTLIDEKDSGVKWPQHICIDGENLLVAGWDSGAVAKMALVNGIPREPMRIFECDQPGWIVPGGRLGDSDN